MKRLLFVLWFFMPMSVFADSVCPAGYTPTKYTQLEYIESTGTQYIDTGVSWENSTKIEFTIERLGDNAGQAAGTSRANVWFGANGSTGLENMLGWGDAGSTNYFRGSTGVTRYVLPLNTKTKITFDYTKGALNLFVNSVQNGDTGESTNIITSKVLLGGIVDIVSPYVIYCLERFYGSVKMWNGDALVRNLIPAKRNNDGAIGMYDGVTGHFFANAGTGEFIAGPETLTDMTGNACSPCPPNTYKDFVGNSDCTPCPDTFSSPSGAKSINECGRILHVGDYIAHMPFGRRTEHGLCTMFDGKKYCADVYERQ